MYPFFLLYLSQSADLEKADRLRQYIRFRQASMDNEPVCSNISPHAAHIP